MVMKLLSRFFSLKRLLVMISFISLPGHSKTRADESGKNLDLASQDDNYYVFQLDEEGRKRYKTEFGDMEV